MKTGPLKPPATSAARPAPPPGAARTQSDAALLRAGRGRRAERDGRAAEQAAEAALFAEGWQVLARRLRNAGGEIDLVVRREGLLCFVEVKARASLAEAAASLAPRQQARLLLAAEIALGEHPDWQAEGYRFDVLLVDPQGRIRRIMDTIRQG